jgi:hypothetical protein
MGTDKIGQGFGVRHQRVACGLGQGRERAVRRGEQQIRAATCEQIGQAGSLDRSQEGVKRPRSIVDLDVLAAETLQELDGI